MIYTKQQLINAYVAATGIDAGEIAAEVVRVQAELDSRIAEVTVRRDRIQNRIDNLPSDAKTYMKDIALAYLADQAEEQSDIDNSGVSL